MKEKITAKLTFEAIAKFTLGVVVVGVLIFLPAGTLAFCKGWLFMAVLFVPMLAAGIIMLVKSPELLASRLDAKEKSAGQGAVVKLSGLMFLLGFVLAGLDFRFCWLPLPDYVSYIFSGVMLLGYAMFAEALRENAYLSRTIKVVNGQKVVDTGLYSIVRHPMYSATLLLFLAMPLVLGSLISFAVFLIYPVIIVFRILGEENLLEKELEGYREYKNRVKYRLIPFVW